MKYNLKYNWFFFNKEKLSTQHVHMKLLFTLNRNLGKLQARLFIIALFVDII